MMKRLLSLLLAGMLLMGCFPAAMADNAALPQVGDVVHGFEVKEVGVFSLINADLVYFIHQKTGAELLYLANEDTNRVFELSFKTPAESDMGVPHVFEHATLGGSEKYPSRDLFFNLSYQTYNTYMNAGTYSHMTTYPVASLSEEQLYRYADFYTDSCFNPMVHEDKSIFDEEAWRYSMASADSELTISGTVYSEMQGAYTLNSAAYQNFMDIMYPGSTAANSSGGVPSEIPGMTWEDVTAYHDAYYHPSNSLACLYGSFENYERFLALLDSYYSAYEKADIIIADAGYTPITQPQSGLFEYAVEATSNTDKGGMVYYGFRCDVENEDSLHALSLLSILLGSPSFPVIQALKEALPTATCGCSLTLDTPAPSLVFYANGVNAEDAELFRTTVDTALAKIMAEGLDQTAVDAVIAAFRLDVMLVTESATLGVDMIPNIAYYWASTGDWHSYPNYIASLDRFSDMAANGDFIQLMEKYLSGSSATALAMTIPVAGLKEQQDAALAAELAQVKAGMTEEEINAIVANTQALAQQSESSAAEYVSQLQAVTVSSLPEEVRVYDYTDATGEDGVRRIDVAANVDGVGTAMVLLDMADLPQEYLHWFQLYVDLLCEVDTSAHDRTQLAALTTRYLYNGVIKASMPYDKQEHLYLRAAWIAADEDMQAAYDLVKELLFDSQFTDAQRIAEAVSARKTSLKTSITNNIYSSQLSRAQSISNPSTRLYTYMTDIDYYLFLEQVEAVMAQQPELAMAALQTVQAMVNNASGAISAFAGSIESAYAHRPIADAFLAGLNKREVVPAVYNLPVPARAEGIVVDSSVQYNLLYATWEELGLKDYSGDLDAVTSLVSDVFLLPMLRDQYGAYSVLHGAAADGVYLLTYRDPNIAETFTVYAMLPTLLGQYTTDQATLDGYILSAYAYYAQSAGELSGAENAIFSIIADKPQDEALGYMQALKSVKAEDFSAYVNLYTNLIANGAISTAGGAGAITANAAMYENVLNPFGAVDPTSVAFEDCGEEHPLYSYVRFAFENGLMAPAAETAFGVDTAATVGDFSAACYVLLGGGLNPEEGTAYLQQFGIIPADATPATELTRADMVTCIANFFSALGMPVTPGELAAYEDAAAIPEGLAPIFAWALNSGFIAPATETTLAPEAIATRGELALMMTNFTSMLQ